MKVFKHKVGPNIPVLRLTLANNNYNVNLKNKKREGKMAAIGKSGNKQDGKRKTKNFIVRNTPNRIPEEEKDIYISVLGKKIANIQCENPFGAKFYETYHTVKGKDYPALYITCGGKRTKIHINQAEMERINELKVRRRIGKFLSEIEKLENLPMMKASIEELAELLKRLEEVFKSKKYWEFLYQNRELLRNLFPTYHYEYEDGKVEVEIVDIEPLKELRIIKETYSPLRKSFRKEYKTIRYLAKDDKKYILSLNPPRILVFGKKLQIETYDLAEKKEVIF
jgi:hypothetical protein